MTCSLFILALVLPAMDIDSLTANLHLETAFAYIEQGLPDKALGEFTLALEIDDSAYEAYLGLGRIAVLNGSWAAAEENYATYMSFKPDDYRAPLEMAELFLLLPGRLQDALYYSDTALSLAPLNGQCWLAAAQICARLGNVDEAISWYSRIIIEDELLACEARVQMGMLLFQQGRLSESREILLPAAASGRAEAFRILALLYLEQRDSLRAIDSINRYLYIEPQGLWADSARACLEELGSGTILNN